MKRLYVSDLDGTLFTTKKKLTDRTVKLLNECLDQGIAFAVATARMPYGCDYRLDQLHLSTPSILTNGVFLYDFNKKKYLSVKTIAGNTVRKILKLFKQYQTGVFLYSFEKDQISLYYNRLELTDQTQYYSDRALEVCKTVEFAEDLDPFVKDLNIFYIACTGPKEVLEPIVLAVEKIQGVACAFYLNIYNGLYCIEIFTDQATKKYALLELKELLACDEVVVFGDNLNDLPMFEAGDRCYAVENALDEVKVHATKIIPGCDEDGVAIFIHNEVFGS